MCIFIVDLFQSASPSKRWLVCFFVIVGIFSAFYWFLFIPLLFSYLKKVHSDEDSDHHWTIPFFGIALLVWIVIIAIIFLIWYTCRNRSLRIVEEKQKEQFVKFKADLTRVNSAGEKARQTLGLDEELISGNDSVLGYNWKKIKDRRAKYIEAMKKSNILLKGHNDQNMIPSIRTSKKDGEEQEIDKAQITPLPKYSPEAKNDIFNFSENEDEITSSVQETRRSASPFRDFLHLVQIESPGNTENTFEEEMENTLNQYLGQDVSDVLDFHDSTEELVSKGSKDSSGTNSFIQHHIADNQELEDHRKTYVLAEDEHHIDGNQEFENHRETYVLTDDEMMVHDAVVVDEIKKAEVQNDANPSVETPDNLHCQADENESNPKEDIEIFQVTEQKSADVQPSNEIISEHSEDSTAPDRNSEDLEEPNTSQVCSGNLEAQSQQQLEQGESTASLQEVEEEPPKVLMKKESALFLGAIGRANSVLSEMYIEVGNDGTLRTETAVLMGRHEVLKSPL